MKLKTKIIFIVFVALLLLSLYNIKSYADTFTLEETNANVKLNGTIYLSYSGGSGDITWESDDSSIASVNNGTVEGKKIGRTTIKATRGNENASCVVNVVYESLTIGANEGKSVPQVNLILGEHGTENLIATVKDGDYEDVTNPQVTWQSDDTSVVTIDETTGVITGIKPGTANITASAAGVSDTCMVTVYAKPVFTDFSEANYTTSLNWDTETLKITGMKPDNEKTKNKNYYYMITSSKTKPNIIKTEYGTLDTESMGDMVGTFLVNAEENYIYTRELSKYTELNQNLYIWILQDIWLEDYYYDTNGNFISHSTKFVVEGKEIKRAELPQLNLILQSFNIGYFDSTVDNEEDNYTYIHFNFPTATQNRKFTIKIGKITDNSILSKIQKNDYNGIKELLTYAKNHNAIYSETLTTTSTAYYRNDTALFDGKQLLEDDAYYFIYVEFDNENGKYYPIEGVTLGQAWLSTSSNSWDLWAYTSSDFKWDGLTPDGTEGPDTTTSPNTLPKTGLQITIAISLVFTALLGIIFYNKYNKYKEIK